jgi:hypothetical protein
MDFCLKPGSTRKQTTARWIFLLLTLALFAGGPQTLAQSKPTFDSVEIDALDPDAWNGIVFLAKAYQQPAHFALRLGSRYSKFLDGKEVFDAVAEVGPHAPDGSYCRFAWRQPPGQSRITLEWSRVDKTTVVGRVTAPKNLQLVLETYLPFSPDRVAEGWSKTGLFSCAPVKPARCSE